MEPNYPNIALVLLFACAILAMWGAWQGWFSPVIRTDVVAEKEEAWKAEKTQLQDALQRAKDTLFAYENVVPELRAGNQDSTDQAQMLMDQINALTKKIQALEAENDTLRKGLKEALDDLARCRELLMQCKAQLDARRLESQYCQQEVPSNQLY